MVRLSTGLVAAATAATAAAASSPVIVRGQCSVDSNSCHLPHFRPFMMLQNYQPARKWCRSRHPVAASTSTVVEQAKETERSKVEERTVVEVAHLDERGYRQCGPDDYLCSIFQSLQNASPDVRSAMCACIHPEPQPITTTTTTTVTKRNSLPTQGPADTYSECPVDSDSCHLPRYEPFALLEGYRPAAHWCASTYPIHGHVAARGYATGSECPHSDVRCSILQDLQSAPWAFGQAMCSCLRCPSEPSGYQTQPNGYPSQPTGYQTQPNGYPSQPTGYQTQPNGYPTHPNGYPSQPTGYPTTTYGYPTSTPECALAAPTPVNATCGLNAIYDSPSQFKLIEEGNAATLDDCATGCSSTINCTSISFSAPETGGLGICDFYQDTVAGLNSSGLLITTPVVAGQTLQDFFDIVCFNCPRTIQTTAPPLPSLTASTITTITSISTI